MNRKTVVILFATLLTSCEKKDLSNKIMDGLTVNATQTVVPAQAAQQYILLKRDSLRIIVSAINRLTLSGLGFDELSGPDGSSRYSFQTRQSRYGTATCTLQFRDAGNGIIDPIAVRTTTATIKTVEITCDGQSGLFTYSEALTLTFGITGDFGSPRRLTGTSSFNGSGISLTLVLAAPGSNTSFESLTDGTVNATGTGPTAPISLSLGFSSSHESNGTISWEGMSGGIHLADNGDGFVVTDTERIPLD